MRLVLEATSESHRGKKIWLQAGQAASVGRTDHADFVLPYDRLMSGLHFALLCDHSLCRLRDLNSLNGTFVNGERVSQRVLQDRDHVLAGETDFMVHLEGADLAAASQENSDQQAHATIVATQPVESEHAVGSWRFRCVPEGWAPAEEGLRCLAPKMLLVTLVVNEMPLPQDMTFEKYMDMVTGQLAESPTTERLEGPKPVTIEGAEEGVDIVLRNAPSGDIQMVQRQIYACHGRRLGTSAFVTTGDELEAMNPEFDRIVEGMAFNVSQQPVA